MTDAPVLIRPARHEDVDAMTGLLTVLFGVEADFQADTAVQRRGLELLLADARALVLAAEAGGRVVGMCTGQVVISTAEGGPSILVEDVVVEDGWRGRGVGRALMDAISGWAVERGAGRLQLLADKENAPALDFYDRIGWHCTQLVCLRRRETIGA